MSCVARLAILSLLQCLSVCCISVPLALGITRKSVDVRAFGARGDGIFDDTTAFNHAYAALAGTGGRIHVAASPGCYMVTEVIRRSRVILSGDGPDSTCIKNLAVSGVSVPLLSVPHTAEAITDEIIENLTLDGNRNAQSGIANDGDNDCIFLRGYRNTILRNLVITNCYTDGIYVVGAGPLGNINGIGLLIDRVVVSNSRRNNLSIICGDNIVIRASSFQDANGTAPQSGIDIEPDAAGQSSKMIDIAGDVVFKDNRGAGLSIFNGFQSQPSMRLKIDGKFIANNVAAINIISNVPYIVGGIHINGIYKDNGRTTRIAIALSGVRDVVVENANVAQNGVALRAENVSHLEIGRRTRLSGTREDLQLAGNLHMIHLGSRKVLTHRAIGGPRFDVSGN